MKPRSRARLGVFIFVVVLFDPCASGFAKQQDRALVAAGIWVGAAPASVPGLVQPDSPAAQKARDRMMGMSPAMKPMTPMKPKPEPVPRMRSSMPDGSKP